MSFLAKLIYAPIVTTTEVEKFIDGVKLVKKRLAKPKDSEDPKLKKRLKDVEIYRKSFLENTKKFLKENPKQVFLWILCILAAPFGIFIAFTFLRDILIGRISFERGFWLSVGLYICASAFHYTFKQIGEELWRIDVKGFNAVKKARKKAADKAKREAEEAAAKAKKAKEEAEKAKKEAQAKERAKAAPANPEGTSETAEPAQPATEGTSETTDSDSETNVPESAAEASDATNDPDDPSDSDAPNDGWLVYDDPDDEEYFLD